MTEEQLRIEIKNLQLTVRVLCEYFAGVGQVEHRLALGPGRVATITCPHDLTRKEAQRIGSLAFALALPVATETK